MQRRAPLFALRTPLSTLLGTLLCALSIGAPAGANAQDGGAVFSQRCAACHSIGEGQRVGPDLANVHQRRERDWLHRFIKTPGTMLDSDPDAQALLSQFSVRMPDLGLDDATVDAVITYIEQCSAGDCAAAAGGGARPVSEATPADVALGRQLFLGEAPLANGGPACISCHRTDGLDGLGGGTLAIDLTQTFARLGEAGLDGALSATPFPVMNTIFPDRPITPEESFALKAYLADVSRRPPAPGTSWVFPLAGLGCLGLAFVGINVAWRRRLTHGVRRPLLEKRRAEARERGEKP
ncbi:MAG: cytochrome c [Sandaracinaceae bacterium]|nr:cytochrome c [Sandaracinaceae bacterium]